MCIGGPKKKKAKTGYYDTYDSGLLLLKFPERAGATPG